MENNKRIAQLLRQLAALLDEQGVAFKPAAYRHAAQVLDDLKRDISAFKDVKELENLPGIGESITKKIQEFLSTGKIAALEKLRMEQGGISAELMDIEGLGPRRIRQIESALGVSTVVGLIKAAEEGKLQSLPRFSVLLERKVLENARRVSERVRRFTLAEVKDDAEALLKKIRFVPGVERSEAAGSFRRRKETVGDIDVVVVTSSAKKVSEAISELPIVRNVVAHGESKLSFDLKSGIRVDIRFVKRSQWGAALLYFTGNKEHNIMLRKLAIRRGWKLNEYGLFQGESIIASREEEGIYKALGLEYVPPEKRIG